MYAPPLPISTQSNCYNVLCLQVETLIAAKLADLSIGTDMLADACTTDRQARDINMNVFNRLVALDDFMYFKKMMVCV